jgi:hypothetical protein
MLLVSNKPDEKEKIQYRKTEQRKLNTEGIWGKKMTNRHSNREISYPNSIL